MFKAFAAMVPLLLVGCLSYNVEPYGKFDLSKKTMTVSRGGDGLLGTIKRALRKDGWKLSVDRGPRTSEATVTTDGSKVEEFDTFHTKYRISVDDRWVDLSLSGDGIYRYDISIVDNDTGEEILTMHGRGSESTIAERLIQAIKDNAR